MYYAQDEVLSERPFSYSMLSMVTGQFFLHLFIYLSLLLHLDKHFVIIQCSLQVNL